MDRGLSPEPLAARAERGILPDGMGFVVARKCA
jgi:hypothetical protein